MSELVVYPLGEAALSILDTGEEVRVAAIRNVLVDNIDPATGELASMLGGLHPVDAAIVFQFQVAFGSGEAVRESGGGHRFADIKKVDEAAAELAKAEARRVLARFEAKAYIRVESVTAAAAPLGASSDTVGVHAVYTNLLSGRSGLGVRT